jgi:hypothetical protein
MAGMIPTLRADFPPLLVQNLLTLQSNYHESWKVSLSSNGSVKEVSVFLWKRALLV